MGSKKHSSKWYYDRNAASKAGKYEYDKIDQKKPERVKNRVEANQANRVAQANGTANVGYVNDYDHEKDKMVSAKNNRERNYKPTKGGYKMKTKKRDNGKNNAKSV
jgi:hypothetical protein